LICVFLTDQAQLTQPEHAKDFYYSSFFLAKSYYKNLSEEKRNKLPTYLSTFTQIVGRETAPTIF
jgi:cation transport regulator ChaB